VARLSALVSDILYYNYLNNFCQYERLLLQTFGDKHAQQGFQDSGQVSEQAACHPEPIRGVYPERSEWAQGKLREGSSEASRCPSQ